MTIEEKRQAICEHCCSLETCMDCPLALHGIKHCWYKPIADEEVDKNYALLFGGDAPGKLNLLAIVRNIMDTDEKARKNDGQLFLAVLEHIGASNGYSPREMTLERIGAEMRAKRLPTFDQVQMTRSVVEMEEAAERVLQGG